jgi:hypothetical protein
LPPSAADLTGFGVTAVATLGCPEVTAVPRRLGWCATPLSTLTTRRPRRCCLKRSRQ